MKPLLMLSLPNSGSTWFAETIASVIPGCRYAMEFFNPARNEKYEKILARQFGAELISCYRNIASPGDPLIDRDIAETWGREDYTFTKEVFSPCKLQVFTRHFDCFVFWRSEADTFPPSRPRVWSFYEHAWFALRESCSPELLFADDMRSRAREAHARLTGILRDTAFVLDVPAIEYRELFGSFDSVAESLRRVFADEIAARLAAQIVGTRNFKERVA